MSARGAGDRWMAGELPEGVRFAPNDTVQIVTGPHAGERGLVRLLLLLEPEPLYLVRPGGSRRGVRVLQSGLRRVE